MTKVYQVFSEIGDEIFYRLFASAEEAEKKFDEEFEKLKQIISPLGLHEQIPMDFDDMGGIKGYTDSKFENQVKLTWIKVY